MLAQVLAWAAGCVGNSAATWAAILASKGSVSGDLSSPQAGDSSVGTERGVWFSLFLALGVAAAWETRPRLPPRPPLSVALPRPRADSAAARPPRAVREPEATVDSLFVAEDASFALGFEGFLVLATSPHWEMLPKTYNQHCCYRQVEETKY